jgi:acyl carrier protein
MAVATPEEQKKTITGIIVDKLGVSADKVTPEADIVTDLGADSLDQVEIVMAVEDAFNIEISDDDAEKIKTVKDIFEYVEKRLA